MTSVRVAALLLCCLWAISGAAALFEEQAGLTDWHLSHVGDVSSLLFRNSAQQSVVVGTRSNVIAAISTGSTAEAGNVASGETKWRQVLPEGERIVALSSYSKLRVLSLSSPDIESPATVRAWSSKDGNLVWEAPLQSRRTDVLAKQTAALTLRRKLRVQGAAPVRAGVAALSGGAVLAVSDSNGDSKSDVVAVHGGVAELLSGIDGASLWSWAAAAEMDFFPIGLAARDGQVAIVARSAGALQVVVLKLADGSQVSQRTLADFTAEPTKRNVLLAAETGVLVLLQNNKLSTVHLFDAQSTGTALRLDLAAIGAASHAELLTQNDARALVAVFGAGKQLVVEVPRTGASISQNVFSSSSSSSSSGDDVELAWTAHGAEATGVNTAPLVRATLTKGSILRVEAFALGSGNNKAAAVLVNDENIGSSRGGLKHLWVEAVSERQTRLFLTCVDESLSLFETSSSSSGAILRWTREEALGSVTDVQFVELPAGSLAEAANEEAGRYPNFFARVAPQIQGVMHAVTGTINPAKVVDTVKDTLQSLQRSVQAALNNGKNGQAAPQINAAATHTTYSRPLDSTQRDSLLSQDNFGFRKLLLVSTGSGKLFGLESQSGSIVWSRFVAPETPDQSTEEKESVTPAWKVYVLSHHEAVAIVHEEDAKSSSHLVAFNPLSGETVRGGSQVLSFRAATALVLPLLDSHSRHLLLVAGADGQLALYPNTEEATGLLRARASEVFYFLVDASAQVLRGFNVHVSTTKASLLGLEGVQTWSLRFPSSAERLVSVVGRPAHEVVQSAVRVLGGGDGGFLFKYLNPNMIAVATVRLSPAQQIALAAEEGDANAQRPRVVPSLQRTTDPSVNVYLLDTVTGAVLEKIVHRGAEGPVTLLQSENSVLAHFYNAAAGQWELSVADLFETRAGDNSGAGSIGPNGVVPGASSVFDGLTVAGLSTLGAGASRLQPFNSFSEPTPQALTQTFTFRSALTVLGVSQTRRGITSKEFLMGLPSGQVYALPRALVDPRRPIADPTPLERAEQLIPYSAALPLDRLRFVSHVRSVAGVRGLASSPALLESTSLVCAYGLDVFCTRVTPSQTFDLLNEDFNSPFLLLTVSAVFAAIFFTRRMAKQKELAAAWK